MSNDTIFHPARRRSVTLRVLFTLGLAGLLLPFSPSGAAEPAPSVWDRDLPSLELSDVLISADRLEDAWKYFATESLVRSVLFVDASVSTLGRFDFQAERATARDVLDALAAAYPAYTWSADPDTGVLWLHPGQRSYETLLASAVQVPRQHCAVPMQTGFLEPLAAVPGLGVEVAGWGAAFTNTFDYAVDVAAGEHRVRDLLNRVAAANPTKTFYVLARDGATRVTAVNLVSDTPRTLPAGALRWWELHFGPARGGAPSTAELIAALSAPEAGVRAAARVYLEALVWQTDLDGLVRAPSAPRERVWTALAVTSILVRHPEATHRASIDVLSSAVAALAAGGADAELALLAALELVRLTGEAQHLETAERVMSRALAADRLADTVDDLLRLAQGSEAVREFLEPRLEPRLAGRCPVSSAERRVLYQAVRP